MICEGSLASSLSHIKICVDESLVPWKRRLASKRDIRTKRHQFGIKVFILGDCETGASLNFTVCTGSSTEFNMMDP